MMSINSSPPFSMNTLHNTALSIDGTFAVYTVSCVISVCISLSGYAASSSLRNRKGSSLVGTLRSRAESALKAVLSVW